jgi:hypothetical protein
VVSPATGKVRTGAGFKASRDSSRVRASWDVVRHIFGNNSQSNFHFQTGVQSRF